ncbi:DUF488 domain-containing protein [Actinoplanes rectilineatus]|uniref:DUF488 domain-containing protein n=1 Tax=Actinoplanes rectilineatus TaxID=113571 RepID=UPI0005F2EC46|nr:DUF488 family protein [Actinoplanes rectilineatus]
MAFQVKRIHDEAGESDGFRVLVDRRWPEDITEEQAALDLWAEDAAPSSGLWAWSQENPDEFTEFSRRYRAELDANPVAVAALRKRESDHATVTLLHSGPDTANNHARLLADYLASHPTFLS